MCFKVQVLIFCHNFVNFTNKSIIKAGNFLGVFLSFENGFENTSYTIMYCKFDIIVKPSKHKSCKIKISKYFGK